jgi:alpha-amylase/alpha-mannosidase (GH57 family)
MTHPLYIAFIWHQHQPLYKARSGRLFESDRYYMPWVRLHGTKDYLDLIQVLQDYPQLHQTVNLVPSLILQLEDYAAGKAIDPYLALTLTPEDTLTDSQKQAILHGFFDANHRTLIDPHPRYRELYDFKQEKGLAWCLNHWTKEDYSDLLAWHNLAWIDPLFWDDPEIEAWLRQGRGFSLSDRQRIIAKQRQIICRILPLHRQMQEAGQLEITTTPYSHPILPLLADTNSGSVAVPSMTLPRHRFQWAEDIPRHLAKAKTIYRDRFGCEPKGLWPSEQSISPAILPAIAQAGFQWLCSDEAVLGWSIQHFFHRDETGNITEPHLLYRPYRLPTPQGDLAIIFRDHRLSDLIGFTYSDMDAHQAATDLIGHLQAIHRSYQHYPHSDRPWLVTIALDGENCWEHYPKDGLDFLRILYSRLSADPALQLVTVSEYLDRYPPTVTLPPDQLHSGSWVDGSFTTWIGDPVKNKAWDLLAEARQVLANHPEATEEANPDAWEALYAAEGSDWFWWFGEGHSSNQDDIFDRLFRQHLAGIYRALNESLPPSLHLPLEDHARKGNSQPESFIHPVIDGVGDEQDWDKAGRLEVGGARGTMHQSSLVQRLYYGLNHRRFFLRVDFRSGVQWTPVMPSELHLLWYYPQIPRPATVIPLMGLPDLPPLNYRYHHHLGINLATQTPWLEEAQSDRQWHPRSNQVEVAWDKCLELSVPWADLHMEPDTPLHLIAILAKQGEFDSFLPESHFITLQIP